MALNTARTELPVPGDDTPSCSVYDEPIHLGLRAGCHLKLGDGHHAADYAQQSLQMFDRSFTRLATMITVTPGRAYVQCGEIDEAARLLGDAGDIATGNSSTRLLKELKQARAELQPWEHTSAVRTLDDRLVSCGLA